MLAHQNRHGMMRNHPAKVLDLRHKRLGANQDKEENRQNKSKERSADAQGKESHEEEHPARHETHHVEIVETEADIIPIVHPDIHGGCISCQDACQKHHDVVIHITLSSHFKFPSIQ